MTSSPPSSPAERPSSGPAGDAYCVAPDLPCSCVDLVPHRSPMLLVERLEEFEPDSGRVSGRVADSSPFLHPDGTLDRVALVEMVAQAAAAHDGYDRRRTGRPPVRGMLVGLHGFRLSGTTRLGDAIDIRIRRGFALGEFHMVEGTVLVGGEPRAEGEIKIYETDAPTPDAEGVAPAALPPMLEGPPFPLASRCRETLDRNGRLAEYRLGGSLPVFHGHFPGSPVLPAVATLALAIETVGALTGQPLVVRGIESAKFRMPLTPETSLTVHCEPRSAERWRVNLTRAGSPAASALLDLETL